MARFGVNILKSFTFRGTAQHFGNTYYYSHLSGSAGDLGPLNDLIDKLVVIEKARHTTDVTFLRARLWSQVGTQAQNQMLIDRALSGAGALAVNASMDRERAFLLQIRAGVDTKGRPVYLRKWFHLMVQSIGGVSITNGQLQNTEGLTQAQRDSVAAIGTSLMTVQFQGGSSGNWDLVSKNGRQITGSASGHPFLEHHQLGDMWRGS